MNLKWMAVLGFVLLTGQAFAGEQLVLKTQIDKESYSTGINIVRTLKQQGGEVNLDVVIQGMMDGLTGQKLLLTEEEIGKAMAALQTAQMQRQKQALVKMNDAKAPVAGMMTKTEDAGPTADPGIQKMQDPQVERAEQGGLLASKEPTGSKSVNASIAGSHELAQVQAEQGVQEQQGVSADQGVQRAPNGTVLSKRNLARLSVAEMKQEMRKLAASGETGP
jgi:hypothetical protein